MHALYTTKGWVLRNQTQGEANASILLYTEEFGLIRAHAQGLRKGKSKLAGHLMAHTFGEYSLVKGREVWRLVGAVSTTRVKGEERKMFSRIAKLIERLIHGEEKSEKIFLSVEQALACASGTLNEREFFALELFLNTRILHLLGYLPSNDATKPYLEVENLDTSVLGRLEQDREVLLREVNRSLRESQM